MQRPNSRQVAAWANKNLFQASVDSLNRAWDTGYQDWQPPQGSNAVVVEDSETSLPAPHDQQPQPLSPSHHYPKRSYTADEDQNGVVMEEGDPHCGKEPITSLQAAWNVTNAIQGMFIVGLPYAVKVGGWWAVFAMVAVAWVCNWTGVLLVDCLYEKDGTKIRRSYGEVAEAFRPGFGKVVLTAQLIELLSTCIIYLVLAADLLQGSFPYIDKPAWMMLVATVVLSCAFLDSLVVVSQLSLANAVSHLIVNAIILIYCVSQWSDWSFGSVRLSFSLSTFPTVIGVVVFGYTSHIFLPALEGSMQKPSEFRVMLKWSHIAAALFKSIFGLMGFLTFGEFTQKEISNSLPNQGFKILVNLVLVVKALLSYPLPYFAAVQLLKDNLFLGTSKTLFVSCYSRSGFLREWALFLRILLVLFTLFVALSVPYLIELMGLIGNITGTMLSFVWPALFHLRLKGSALTNAEKRFDQFVIGLGLAICTIGVYFSLVELGTAIQEDTTR